MTLPTETFSNITTAECQPNKPMTSELALKWRGNLLASLQGASSAQRALLGCFERLAAGATQKAINSPAQATPVEDDTWQTAWEFGLIQGGTLRFGCDLRVSDSAIGAESRVSITRAGTTSTTTIQNTSSETFVTATVDLTVEPGDSVAIEFRSDSALAARFSEIQNMTLSTAGEDLFPVEGVFGYINGNDTITA